MLLTELLEADEGRLSFHDQEQAHGKTLQDTGFWGAAGAGCIILARDTGRILLAFRSQYVEQPHTWGTWGGAIDQGDDPVETMKKEVHEEAGYKGPLDIVPLFVFKKGSFRYFNFLAIVDKEFKPVLGNLPGYNVPETEDYEWCEYGKWPKPLHFGLVSLLNDPESANKIQECVAETKAKPTR